MMKEGESLLKMIMYLLDCNLFQSELQVPEATKQNRTLKNNLIKAGFDKPHIQLALRWFGLLHHSIHSFISPQSMHASNDGIAKVRIFDDQEHKLLSPSHLKFLYQLRDMNILDAYTMEIVIDMLFEVQELGIDIPMIKFTALIVLYAVPDHQEQLLSLELLVLDSPKKRAH